MISRGYHCLLAWVLAGDLLSTGQRAADFLQPPATATTTATIQQQRVQLFVAGAQDFRVQSASPGTEGEVAPDGGLAHAVARGRELLQKGSLHDAAEVLQGVLASKDDEPSALLLLAEVASQLGQPHRAVVITNRFLGLDLTPEVRSFMLNRRGLYLRDVNDLTGAQESYELALEVGWQGQGINRLALRNLAALLHFQLFPSETAAGPDFSALERAIELYRVALGRGSTALQTALDSNTPGPEIRSQDNGIGGPIHHHSVFRELAAALLLAGRPREAIAELEYAVTELGSEDGNHVVAKPTADEGTAGTTRSMDTALLWDSLSVARRAAGDVPGALAAGNVALSLVDDEPGLYHNMALLLQTFGLLNEARDALLTAVALDSSFSPGFNGLGDLEGARGNVRRAREYYEASLAATRAAAQGNTNKNGGEGRCYHVRRGDEELTSLFLVATAVVPAVYESNDHIAQVRSGFEHGLDQLLAEPANVTSRGLERPSSTVGSGSLGYYIIYQGFEDLEVRRKLARAYWKFAPSLRYCAPFLANDGISSTGDHHQKSEAYEASNGDLPARGDLAGYSSDSVHGDTTTADIESTLSHAKAASDPPPPPLPPLPLAKAVTTSHPTNAEDLSAGAAHTAGEATSPVNTDAQLPCRKRRVKVGFLSAFFFHHSVGLLVEGVATRLDRRRFETTAVFLQPHPTSSTEGKSTRTGEDVYTAVRAGTEHVLDVPVSSLAACRHAIASLQLDVLVFAEIGMNFEAYFLSFARLARRSVLFWGHAVTSGVSALDALNPRSGGTHNTGNCTSEGGGGGLAGSSEKSEDLGGATPGWVEGGPTLPHEVGGIDYFVSSWLFENKSLGRLAQRKYSESLYLMEGLTTRFTRPAPPKPAVVTRETLGIPRQPPPISAAGGIGVPDDGVAERGDGEHGQLPPSCGALYVVPQTLYKLHPDFDRLVAGVLSADLSGCVVFIRAVEATTTESVARRMSRALLAAGVAAERIIFVPRLGLSEFSGLLALADVVLDTFPVGGGRSSFEIFAVGTPIVMLYNRTSILQLTYGMYATMGLEGAIGNATASDASVSLVTYSEDQFSRSAVAIATDVDLNARTRELILANNHRLFEQDSVVAEWEGFLEGIVSVPRPAPTDRSLGLAVDASDFPRNVPWCRNKSSTSSISRDGDEDDTDFADGDAGDRLYQKRTTVHPQTSYGNARPARDELSQETGAPPALAAESYSFTESGGDGHKVSHGGVDDTASATRDRTATTDPSTNTKIREHLTTPLASASAEAGADGEAEAGVAAGSVDEDVTLAGRKPDLLYAINFTVAPPREGAEPMQLSAKVYEGMDPMEEANRLRREGALDFLQYRWVGAVLCRGAGRLERPVVWSTFVRIADGPKALLEIRHGDDLHQVARWHCDRHGLGPEKISVLSTKLEKELPQHADPEWVSVRAADRSCSTPPAPATPSHPPSSLTAPDHAGDRRRITVGSENSNPRGSNDNTSAFSGGAAGAAGTAEARRGREESVGDDDDARPRHKNEGEEGDGRGGSGGECVTLAITTCKRLRAFLGTAEGLQALLGPLPQSSVGGAAIPRVCRVLVVDDGSSPKDRGVMLSSFPRFTFVFKGPEDTKGHAGSMNIILSLTKTRYLLYVEDDWWAVHDHPLPPRSGAGNFLWRAMEVLTKSSERVSQVLVNDQSTRNCAWGDTATCTPETLGTSAGWPRFTSGSLAGQEHGQRPGGHSNVTTTHHSEECPSSGVGGTESCESGGPRMLTFNDDVDAGHSPVEDDPDTDVEYRLHEFGLLYPLHAFTHWPGFSLNPALWDLERLGASYRRRYGRRFEFDPADNRFEQSISAELLDAGVAVAHLPVVTFRHVGAGLSAYEANDMRRPWD